jgi:hypothetical protein
LLVLQEFSLERVWKRFEKRGAQRAAALALITRKLIPTMYFIIFGSHAWHFIDEAPGARAIY